MFTKESKLKRFDFVLFFTAIILCIYGFVIIKSATMSLSDGSSRYLKMQMIAFIIGTILTLVLVVIDYDVYGSLYKIIYLFSNALLLYVLINPVIDSNWGNVRSWMRLYPTSIVFQPAEIAKFGIIIALAKYIDIHKENINNPLVLCKVLAFAFLPVGLILLQPDLGTAIVFVFFIAVMIFASGISYKYVAPVVCVAIVCMLIGVVAIYNIINSDSYNPQTADYKINRIVTFLHPELDPGDTGYQVIQSKTAIGSGMLRGRGLYQGVQNQLNYLPTKETDFIFAVIGEELGLVGGIFLILLYAVLLYRLIRIAKRTTSLFGALIVTGITAMLFFHIFENIGMTMGLLPVTGIPLPFISYGGTFMLVNMVSIGLSLGVGMKKNKFDINVL